MSNYYEETMRNGERYYEKCSHNYSAKMLDGGGFTSRIDTADRTYHIITRVDEKAELVIMEISPTIYCCNEARAQVGEYINLINDKYKCCNIRISHNGNIHAHAEQRFDDAPLSEDMFEIMEGEEIKILDTFEVVLDKLAHMKLISPEEADVEKMIEAHIKRMRKSLIDDFAAHAARKKDDDDDDDEEKPAMQGFREWLRDRMKADAEDEDDDDDEPDEFPDDGLEADPDSLFKEIFGIRRDGDIIDVDPEDVSDADSEDEEAPDNGTEA